MPVLSCCSFQGQKIHLEEQQHTADFPEPKQGNLLTSPFTTPLLGSQPKLCVFGFRGVLPCITVPRSGLEASRQLFVISSGDAGLLSEDQQLLYLYKGNWYNWKHLGRKGVTHCGTTLRTGETVSTGTPSFPPVWGQGMELGWMFAWVHTHHWETPKNPILLSFSKERVLH